MRLFFVLVLVLGPPVLVHVLVLGLHVLVLVLVLAPLVLVLVLVLVPILDGIVLATRLQTETQTQTETLFDSVSCGSDFSSNLTRRRHIPLTEPFHAVCNRSCDRHSECTKLQYFSSEKFVSTSIRMGTPHTLPHRGLWPLNPFAPRSEHIPTPMIVTQAIGCVVFCNCV